MIARIHFAHLPTPIEELPRLSAALGGPRLLVKRDDQTGLAFGGNKTRKLEFLVAEAQEQGAKTLISAGAMQSNHCRQTAAAAARFGLDCILVLTGELQTPPLRTCSWTSCSVPRSYLLRIGRTETACSRKHLIMLRWKVECRIWSHMVDPARQERWVMLSPLKNSCSKASLLTGLYSAHRQAGRTQASY